MGKTFSETMRLITHSAASPLLEVASVNPEVFPDDVRIENPEFSAVVDKTFLVDLRPDAFSVNFPIYDTYANGIRTWSYFHALDSLLEIPYTQKTPTGAKVYSPLSVFEKFLRSYFTPKGEDYERLVHALSVVEYYDMLVMCKRLPFIPYLLDANRYEVCFLSPFGRVLFGENGKTSMSIPSYFDRLGTLGFPDIFDHVPREKVEKLVKNRRGWISGDVLYYLGDDDKGVVTPTSQIRAIREVLSLNRSDDDPWVIDPRYRRIGEEAEQEKGIVPFGKTWRQAYGYNSTTMKVIWDEHFDHLGRKDMVGEYGGHIEHL